MIEGERGAVVVGDDECGFDWVTVARGKQEILVAGVTSDCIGVGAVTESLSHVTL